MYGYLQCNEVTLKTMSNQDGPIIEHVQQHGLHVTKCCFDAMHLLSCDTAEPRVVVNNLVFWAHQRLVGCFQV